MKKILLLAVLTLSFTNIFGQGNLQKIYDAEKAFEKAVADKGLNQAFIEFAAPDGTCFIPGYPVNCIEYFKDPKNATPAALTWNPTFIDVSSNGALGYSSGNYIFRPQGKNDSNANYGEYATVWQRQLDGSYKAVIDLGISHPAANGETKWTSPADSGKELNEKKYSAADTSTAFFEMASTQGLGKAYKTYFAPDVMILREGKTPIVGREKALAEFKNDKSRFFATKRSVFVGAADMAYVSNSYLRSTPGGKLVENGNFLQIWKFRGDKWQIVFDIFVPTPEEKSR